jgi:hypothetical protein
MSETAKLRTPATGGSKQASIALLGSLAVLGLCSFQFGDRYGMNDMPFARVQTFVSDLAHARQMAKQGNIEWEVGQVVDGKTVHLRGELTDANCFLGLHVHAYDHAFCAKLCVAAGSPVVFIPDQGSQLYIVLTAQNGVKLPAKVMDRIGVPGIVVTGTIFEADGLRALAVQGLDAK